MKFEEFFEQMDQVKKAFSQAEEKFDCDEVEMVFKTDDGEMIPINCIEGGYAPDANSHVLIFSSGKQELEKILRAMMGVQTVDAKDMDVGLKVEEMFKDGDH